MRYGLCKNNIEIETRHLNKGLYNMIITEYLNYIINSFNKVLIFIIKNFKDRFQNNVLQAPKQKII